MSTKDGGPAFPCTNEQFTLGNPQVGDAWAGMSLRDWYAGQAMIGAAVHVPLGESRERTIQLIVRTALEIADAMIAEREKPRG